MTEMGTIVEPSVLRFERELPGPIERVWAYLTESDKLPQWFSAGVVTPRKGGEMQLEMGMSGTVTVWDPPHVLEYTWNEPERESIPVFDALVRWELRAAGERVHLTLTHSRIPAATYPQFGAGWHTLLDRIAALLDGRDNGDLMTEFAAVKPAYEARFAS